MNIGVESFITSKVGEMENKTMEGESRRISKDMLGCVQASKLFSKM